VPVAGSHEHRQKLQREQSKFATPSRRSPPFSFSNHITRANGAPGSETTDDGERNPTIDL
jgi:hypothetical protein